MHRIRGKLTYANVISTLALFLVLAGGTAFAAKQMLPKNSVGARQIKNNSVTGAKIRNGSVTRAKIAAGAITTVPSAANATHATTADRAASAETATRATSADFASDAGTVDGLPTSAFAPSTVVRSAVVASNGTLESGKSSGIVQADVTETSGGIYCITGLSPAPVTAVVSSAHGASSDSRVFSDVNQGTCQVTIETYESPTTRAGEPFSILIR